MTSESPRPEHYSETVDLLFDLAKDEFPTTVAQIQSLQGRGGQAFAAGTVLIGFTAIAAPPTASVSNAVIAFLVLAALAYAGQAIAAIVLLHPTEVSGLPHVDVLYGGYWMHPPTDIKETLLPTLKQATLDNALVVARANRAARWAIRFVAAEGAFVAIAVLLSHLIIVPAVAR